MSREVEAAGWRPSDIASLQVMAGARMLVNDQDGSACVGAGQTLGADDTGDQAGLAVDAYML